MVDILGLMVRYINSLLDQIILQIKWLIWSIVMTGKMAIPDFQIIGETYSQGQKKTQCLRYKIL